MALIKETAVYLLCYQSYSFRIIRNWFFIRLNKKDDIDQIKSRFNIPGYVRANDLFCYSYRIRLDKIILLTRSNVTSLVRTWCKVSAILHVIIHCTFYKKAKLFEQLLHWHTNRFTYMVFFNHNHLKAGIHTNECIVQNKTFFFFYFSKFYENMKRNLNNLTYIFHKTKNI